MRSRIATITGRLALCGAASLAIAAGTASAQARTASFNIQQQDLGQALSEFARQSNQQLLYSPDIVRGRQARALRGTYAADEALRKLLADTGISVRTTSAGTFLLSAAAQQPQQAEEPAPRPPEAAVAAPTEEEDEDTIIVTGTQIRGIAPVGSNVVALSEEQIQATGATNTQQLLATLPQASSFNNLTATLPGQGVAAGVGRVPIARPNIRRLPGCAGAGTGACTLILLDGHRIVPAGMEQIAVDPNVIPPGIIQRVETILDGNSAIYGSDAIGGVINFITRKRYDGVKVDGRVGLGDDYTSYDTNLTAGTDWGSGSFVASYSYGHNDAIFGRDRDYVKSIDWRTGLPSSGTTAHLQCALPTITVGGVNFAAPSLTPGANLCDPSQDASIYPRNTRHTGYASLSQDITDGIVFDLVGFYSDFRTESINGPFRAGLTIRPTNPFYRQIPGRPGPIALGGTGGAQENYTANLNYSPAFGNDSSTAQVRIKSWQVTPTITADLGGDWQVRALGSYGWSKTQFRSHDIDTTAQNNAVAATATTAATALNPFDIASTNPAILANINDFFNRSQGINRFYNLRAIGDGPLFDLPGGVVRASFGLEYMKNKFKRRTTNSVLQAFNPFIEGSVAAWSAFGEVFVPIFGEGNRTAGLHTLNLSVSARYDHYDQGVGGTFNPKIGVTYEPVNWVTFRANWGKSFNAPTAADRVGEAITTVSAVGLGQGTTSGFVPTGTVLAGGVNQFLLFLTGTAPGLTPQKAKNWALGIDLRPPFAPNLTFSATYYNIRIQDFIGLPQIGADVQQAFRDFPELLTLLDCNPATTAINGCPTSDDRVQDYVEPFPISAATALATVMGASGVVVQLGPDNRVRNLGIIKAAGLDFTTTYRRDFANGSFDLRFNANLQLKRDLAIRAGNPFVNTLFDEGVPDFVSSLVVGANIGSHARFQVTWNHTGKYDFNTALTPNVLQSSVDGFDSIDLFFRYDVKGRGLARDLAFTFNANNVFDAEPPIYRTTNGGTGFAPNIRTLGRVLLFGLEKEF